MALFSLGFMVNFGQNISIANLIKQVAHIALLISYK